MINFWSTLPRPFFVQAPMEDVTDVAFRRMIARYGKPHVMFTEFTSADGLILADERGQAILRKKLEFDENERPIVAQLFSAIPERMERAAEVVQELGFNGLDINMGCPDRAVEKSGCGADLIKYPDRAKALIRAAKRGAPRLPLSVKTRIGYRSNEIPVWIPALLEEDIAALTIHARTRNEMSDVPARWDTVAEAVAVRNRMGLATAVIGNGDVKDCADARRKAHASGCDGVMLGRAIYGDPWLYSGRDDMPTPREKIAALLEHLELFEQLMSGMTHYAVMKKHFKAYISGWDGAKELRAQLMATSNTREACALLRHSIRQ